MALTLTTVNTRWTQIAQQKDFADTAKLSTDAISGEFLDQPILVGVTVDVVKGGAATADLTVEVSADGTTFIKHGADLDGAINMNSLATSWYALDMSGYSYPYFRVCLNEVGTDLDTTGKATLKVVALNPYAGINS